MADYQDSEFVDSLTRLMHGVLDSVVSVFDQAMIELPERRYLTMGSTAHDCEQVTVSFQQAYAGTPGDEAQLPQKCEGPRTAVLEVEIVRCMPNMVNTRKAPTPPTAAAMTDYADQRARDVYMLLEAVLRAQVDDWLGVLADVTVTEPQGAYQAVSATLSIAIP